MDGNLLAVRFRFGLTGHDSKWRTRDHPYLYGLDRFNQFPGDNLLLVEGESDTWTAWLHDFPCLGVPGAKTWKDDWAALLKGKRVYLWREPDQGGTTLVEAVGKSVKDLLVITPPANIKDLSALHLSSQNVKKVLNQLMKEAVTLSQVKERERAEQNEALKIKEAKVLARVGTLDTMELMSRGLRQAGCVIHNELAALLLILSTTRHFARPVNLRLVAPSSVGKSSIIDFALKFLPSDEVLSYTRITAAALNYFTGQSLKGKVLFVAQHEGSQSAAYPLQMATDGSLTLLTTTKDKSSRIHGQETQIQGPVLYITTSVLPESEEQSCSRIWEIALEPHKDLNRKIVHSCFAEEPPGGDNEDLLRDFMDVVSDRAQAGEPRLEPLFAEALAGLLESFLLNPKINRYCFHLKSAIKAAHLCLPHPPPLAGMEAYELVYELLAPVFAQAFSGMSPQIHKILSLLSEHGAFDKDTALTANEISKISREPLRTAQSWCKAAFDRKFLSRTRQNESQPYRHWAAQVSYPRSGTGFCHLPTPIDLESTIRTSASGVTAAHLADSCSVSNQTSAQAPICAPCARRRQRGGSQ